MTRPASANRRPPTASTSSGPWQREVAVLRYYLQLNTREVASALELEEGTVKSTLFRARAALAQTLGIDENEEASNRGPG